MKKGAEFHICVIEKINTCNVLNREMSHDIGARDHNVNVFPWKFADTCRKHYIFFSQPSTYLYFGINHSLQKFIIYLLSHWTPDHFNTEVMPFDTKIITHFYQVLKNEPLQQWRS